MSLTAFGGDGGVDAFLNIHSGWDDGSGCSEELAQRFKEKGIPLRVHRVERGTDIAAEVQQAVRAGASAVIAAGGDGTLNTVASCVRETAVPMAILPIGTLNHLARDLSIPLETKQAIAILETSEVRSIDLGEVNGRIFLNNSILGLYPRYEFARQRSVNQKHGKWRAMLSALYAVFRRNPSLNARLLINGEVVARRTPYILIANNEHRMEGYHIGNRERLDRGLLWVYVMRRLSRWRLFRLGLSLLFGRFRATDDFETFCAERLEIQTRRRRIGVALDGDVIRMRTPLEYRSLPGALKVLAPVKRVE